MYVSFADMTVGGFLDSLASSSPAPGGGAVAAVSGALGASLVAMVCSLTIGRPKYDTALAKDVRAQAEALSEDLIYAAQKDAAAFDSVIAALDMPKDTEEHRAARSEALQAAYKDAVASPEGIAALCAEVMALAESLLGKSNASAASDLVVAALQAYAGLLGAVENVRVNLPFIRDAEYVAAKREWMKRVSSEAGRVLASFNS
ncbi:MAG: cyclodeaminase/cyclohydrolase family protein [Synergistaceae bacterium]|jgi:formiminotetrahydrofolate cyclodeaminase|nr:cyclodeaminase/cyclohydrolase family protein [Synergistaceae bacterium]